QCGAKQKMPLNIRTYTCGSCGSQRDRDENAAYNFSKPKSFLLRAIAKKFCSR
ncbi:zinc ribbon domain-containing protein, partial [Tolypothrix sp. VBCCA 56010]|uniref:zinc ribbon domain-containing protein n=1 Tax=Tolypothrix sp. VBCCA 56010 TaxID=3137731 RepID=UPI003D7C60B2